MAYESYVLVCGGTACCSGGGDKIVEAFARELESAGLKEKVQVVTTGCLGFCEQGPIVKILPQGTFYVQVREDDVKEIVAEHLVKGRVVQRLCYDPEQAKKLVAENRLREHPPREPSVVLSTARLADLHRDAARFV